MAKLVALAVIIFVGAFAYTVGNFAVDAAQHQNYFSHPQTQETPVPEVR